MILEIYSLEINNLQIRVKQNINAVDIHENYSLMTCNREIPSIANTLKKVHLSSIIFNEFTSIFYDDKIRVWDFCSDGIQRVL